ncbi:MAG: glycoside hydrolase family 3 C-terminal domain-containing protein [Acidobacteriaceae bacterium]
MNRLQALGMRSDYGRHGGTVARDCVGRTAKDLPQIARRFRGARSLLLAAVAVFCVAICGTANAAPAKPAGPVGTPADCSWLNPHLPIAKRVAMLMKKMTVAEEINMVEGHGTHPYVGNTPQIPSLCIPSMGLEDGPNGVGDGLKGVTNLPAGTVVAATFSPRLAYEYGEVIGAEQAAKGSAVDLGPTVNIDRDPRWGREFESFSEDPRLAAVLGVAEIRGIQSTGTMAQVKHFDAYNQETYRNTPKDKVVVSRRALHELYMPAFRAAIRRAKVASIMCAYSTVNGYYSCENHYLQTHVLRDEWNFDGFDTSDWGAVHSVSAAPAGTDLQEPSNRYFGAPLQKEITNGTIPRAVLNTMVERILYQMFRFHFFNHPPSGSTTAVATTPQHQAISTEVAETGTVLLKNDGHLLPLSKSDYIAVIGPAASAQVTYGGGGSAHVIPSSTVSPLAGIEAVAGTSRVHYTQGLPSDAQLTPIPAADLSMSTASKPSKKKRGQSYSTTLTPSESGLYILGYAAGCRRWFGSLVVDGKTLIHAPGSPHSAAIHLNKGQAYRIDLPCSPSKLAWATPSTVEAAIQKAVAAAKSARVTVVVVADDTESEGGDRPDLRLPSAQNELVSAVAKANPHTVVVVQAGAPIAMPWLNHVPALLDTWYPGQTNGTALANVLFGKVDPSGHLPVTFPNKLADVPAASPERFPGVDGKVHYSEGLLVGYRWYDVKHIQPMFPFGFGLSYTHFQYSDLDLSQHEVNGVTPIHVSARVTNVGHVKGTDVAQLYLGLPASTGEPPRKLIAFRRVTLAPGQSKVVHFTITPRDEWWWGQHGWTETAGSYYVYGGDSSALANLPLTAHYQMKQSIGGRQVTVSAPKTFQPGARTVVSVSLSAGGNETLHGVHLHLKAPGGWHVAPLGHEANGDVAPNQVVTDKFAVTPPSNAVTQYVTLYGTADLVQGACTGGNAHPGKMSGRRHHPRHAKWAARCGVRRHGGLTVMLG